MLQKKQGGFALLYVVLLLVLGVASIGLTFHRPSPAGELSDERIGDMFAEVKAALIGYAARQGVFQCSEPDDATACPAQLNASSKLGEFPCPDTDNDGLQNSPCATDRLGRVPWKTLGIPEPKDYAGETLWYAVSLRFLNNASNPIVKSGGYTTSGALNSSTLGDLTVQAADGSAVTTTAVAVIFSPGAALGAQNRSQTVTANCSPAKPNLRRDLCPGNYLDSSASTSNVLAAGPFTVGTPGNAFNDRLVYLLAAEVMPVLEMRLGSELRALLLEYKYNSNCFCFPWADSWTYSGGIADIGINRGRLATTAEPDNWGTGYLPRFPAWVKDNDWHNQVYYSASKRETDPAGDGCLTCSANSDLTVKRTPAVNSPTDPAAAVLITPGTPAPGVQRPYLPYIAKDLENGNGVLYADIFPAYFEDALNNNKSTCPGTNSEHASNPGSFSKQTANASCDTVVQPQSKAYDRDRLWVIPPEDPVTMCPRAGLALVRNTPCKDGGSAVKAVCTTLATKLTQKCSAPCAAAAAAMLVAPCRNDASSSNCPGPRAALLACSAT